jgi:spore maturation protein CgeB
MDESLRLAMHGPALTVDNSAEHRSQALLIDLPEEVRWLARSIEDHDVLEAGGADSRNAIAIARSGQRVLVLRSAQSAIVVCQEALAKETPAVRSLVQFWRGTLSELVHSQPERRFGNIVLCEPQILQREDEGLFELLPALLRPQGRVLCVQKLEISARPASPDLAIERLRGSLPERLTIQEAIIIDGYTCTNAELDAASAGLSSANLLALVREHEAERAALRSSELEVLRSELARMHVALREKERILEYKDRSLREKKAVISLLKRTRSAEGIRIERTPKTEARLPPLKPEREPLPLVIACILDDFSYQNLKYDCHLYKLPKHDFRGALERRRPHMLLVESAWNGNDGDWKYAVTYQSPQPDNPLFALLDYCKQVGIPTVFWNKEDSPNYERFIDCARRFDHIFTTDQNCVPRYEVDAPRSKIGVLPFAAQPALQNPMRVGKVERLGDVCFAGAWYARHPERYEDLRILLEAAKDFETIIYDRYSNHPQSHNYKFPEEFSRYLRDGVPFEEMNNRYRQFGLFLNVNSVKDSPTMFSRRVLEILACGTPVVSGYAQGIERFFGRDIVPMCQNVSEARAAIEHLLHDRSARDRAVLRGQREIFRHHTYRTRLRTLARAVGVQLPEQNQRVSVITATIRRDYVDNLLENFARQTVADKELIVIVNEGAPLTPEFIQERARALHVRDVVVLTAARSDTLGRCLNLGLEHACGSIFAKMDDDDYYGAHYLEDSLHALEYSNADCVGKATFLTYSQGQDRTFLHKPGRQHIRIQFVIGPTLVGKMSLFPEVKFGDLRVGEDTAFLQQLRRAGKTLYSHDEYNYIKYFAADPTHHTWQVSANEYMASAEPFCDGFSPEKCCF